MFAPEEKKDIPFPQTHKGFIGFPPHSEIIRSRPHFLEKPFISRNKGEGVNLILGLTCVSFSTPLEGCLWFPFANLLAHFVELSLVFATKLYRNAKLFASGFLLDVA